MTSCELQRADAGTPLEVLPPVLLNTYKHHAGALRARLDAVAAAGPPALHEMLRGIDVLGTRLMDLYTGTLAPRELSAWVRDELLAAGRFEPEAFRAWLAAEPHFAIVTHPRDGSRWVLRAGDDAARFVHLHPARRSPQSIRVKATVLKTAFVVAAHARVHGGDPRDRAVINAVRAEHLDLPPLGLDPEADLGLGAVLAVLLAGGNEPDPPLDCP